MNISSILRHWFTFAAAAMTAWLVALLTLTPADSAALADALGKLIEPLIVIVSLVAVAVWRIFLAKAGSVFRRGAGEETESEAGSSGGKIPLALLVCTAAGLMGVLPSCLAVGGEYPLTATLSYRDPETGAKAGLTYTPRGRNRIKGGVAVPVYDADTGERIGMTRIPVDVGGSK